MNWTSASSLVSLVLEAARPELIEAATATSSTPDFLLGSWFPILSLSFPLFFHLGRSEPKQQLDKQRA